MYLSCFTSGRSMWDCSHLFSEQGQLHMGVGELLTETHLFNKGTSTACLSACPKTLRKLKSALQGDFLSI